MLILAACKVEPNLAYQHISAEDTHLAHMRLHMKNSLLCDEVGCFHSLRRPAESIEAGSGCLTTYRLLARDIEHLSQSRCEGSGLKSLSGRSRDGCETCSICQLQ
jgi:hypothetical protein